MQNLPRRRQAVLPLFLLRITGQRLLHLGHHGAHPQRRSDLQRVAVPRFAHPLVQSGPRQPVGGAQRHNHIALGHDGNALGTAAHHAVHQLFKHLAHAVHKRKSALTPRGHRALLAAHPFFVQLIPLQLVGGFPLPLTEGAALQSAQIGARRLRVQDLQALPAATVGTAEAGVRPGVLRLFFQRQQPGLSLLAQGGIGQADVLALSGALADAVADQMNTVGFHDIAPFLSETGKFPALQTV